ETTIDLGAVITAAINFLIVAAIVYFIIIVPMNKLNELRKRGAPEEEVPPTTEDLLGDIREILRNQTATAGGPAEGPASEGGPGDPDQPPRHLIRLPPGRSHPRQRRPRLREAGPSHASGQPL